MAVTGAAGAPQLTQLTGYLLRRAYVRASTCTRACISEDSEIETAHVREVAIVAILEERGAMSQRELSDISRIDRRLVVGLIDMLESRGWVRRDRNEADRRSYALRLTAAGREVMVRARTDLARGEHALTGKLSTRQRARLRRHLLALLENDEWLAIDALSRHTGFLIARAHRQVRGWAVEELRPLDIGPRDFGVLAALGQEQPCTQNHLAKVLGVTPSAALAFVEELEGAGLLTRERNAQDRRFYDVTLTAAGGQRLEQANLAATAVQAKVLARLGTRGDAELRRLLSHVISG